MTTPASLRRLSSRLTIPANVIYFAIGTFLGYNAVQNILDGSFAPFSWPVRAALVVVVLFAVAVFLRQCTYVSITLDHERAHVRVLWRKWEIPTTNVAEVLESQYGDFNAIRVTLRDPIPGLGRRFRFIVPFGSEGTEAELLEVARRANFRRV